MKLNKLSTLVALAILPMSASAIVVDFGVSNGPDDIVGFNWGAGNAYIYDYTASNQEFFPPSLGGGGISVNVYTGTMVYQTALSSYEVIGEESTEVFGGSLGLDHEVTLQSSIDFSIFEPVVSGGEFGNGFRIDNGVFNIYLDTNMNKNDKFGTGFDDGDLILGGSSEGFGLGFNLDITSNIVNILDDRLSNMFIVNGAFDIVFDVVDPNFIKDDITGISGGGMFFDGVTAFSQVLPLADGSSVNGVASMTGFINGQNGFDNENSNGFGTIFETTGFMGLPLAQRSTTPPPPPSAPVPVPEPTSLVLLGLGLLGLLRKPK